MRGGNRFLTSCCVSVEAPASGAGAAARAPGLGEFLPINAPMREEPCVFGGHHGVREVVRDLSQGHVLIPPCRVPPAH